MQSSLEKKTRTTMTVCTLQPLHSTDNTEIICPMRKREELNAPLTASLLQLVFEHQKEVLVQIGRAHV